MFSTVTIVMGIVFVGVLGAHALYYSYKGRKAVIVSIMAFMVLLCTCHNCYLKGVDDTKGNYVAKGSNSSDKSNSSISNEVRSFLLEAYQVSLKENNLD